MWLWSQYPVVNVQCQQYKQGAALNLILFYFAHRNEREARSGCVPECPTQLSPSPRPSGLLPKRHRAEAHFRGLCRVVSCEMEFKSRLLYFWMGAVSRGEDEGERNVRWSPPSTGRRPFLPAVLRHTRGEEHHSVHYTWAQTELLLLFPHSYMTTQLRWRHGQYPCTFSLPPTHTYTHFYP